MDKQKDITRIIDWTDRKEAMATYRKYGELGCTGPNYQYYNDKLLTAPEPPVMVSPPVPYKVDPVPDDDRK